MKNYKIYQLPAGNAAIFMSYEFATENGIMPKLADYNEVYSGEVDDTATLDDIYTQFNIGLRSAEYKGRSLSTSDVVEFDGKYFYCDSYGWEEVSFRS